MTGKLSPAHFREPLIQALGHLAPAGSTTSQADVVLRVLADLGIERDSYGFQQGKGTNRPRTVFWIQRAYLALKNAGLGVSGKRGQWGLTPEGLVLLGKVAVGPGEDGRTHPPGEGVVFFVDLGEDVPTPPDGYILNLIYEQEGDQKCYGNAWSLAAPLCSTCPLRAPCSDLFLGLLNHYSLEIDSPLSGDEDQEEEEVEEATGDHMDSLMRQVQAAVHQTGPPDALPTGWRWAVCRPGTCCSKCSQEIDPLPFKQGGTETRMAPFKVGTGMFHVRCVTA